MADVDLVALATEAYVFAYPLVYDLDEVRRFTEVGMGVAPPAPANTFSHATGLAGPSARFVSVNNDTVYSIAQLDLTGGPLLLDVPDAADRYYVLQFVDAWTNNFAYVGRRATGTAAAGYLVAPPGWGGDVPAGTTRIDCPTPIVSVVGRWACAGDDDLPAVRALQRALTLRPVAGNDEPTWFPQPPAGATEAATFFGKARAWISICPPSASDRAVLDRLAPLGLTDDGHVGDDVTAALEAGFAAGRDRVEAASRAGGAGATGWIENLHVFDYNDSCFQVGTVDDPQWIIADRPTALMTRAVAARVGLWGNHGYEAAYVQTFVDADGEQLTGDRRYTLRFEHEPPVDAFWSITMYDLPDYYLVENPIDRYSIGDRTPGLRRDPDGSLTVVMQHDAPADPANWLPTPAGPFRPILRMYQPGAAILDGTYRLPPITRVV